jgi:hypothetical protein
VVVRLPYPKSIRDDWDPVYDLERLLDGLVWPAGIGQCHWLEVRADLDEPEEWEVEEIPEYIDSDDSAPAPIVDVLPTVIDQASGPGTTMFLVGPDADALFRAIEPTLVASPLSRGGYAVKYYGPLEDGTLIDHVAQDQVDLRDNCSPKAM